jgi:hypothetical protein
MKKIIASFFTFLLFTLLTPVFAQTGNAPVIPEYIPPAHIDLTEVQKIINEDDLFGIRASKPSFEDKVYNQGDAVNITLPLKNATNIDYSDITISAYVSVHSKNGSLQNYGYQNNLVQAFISAKTNKDVTFQFKMPNSISFTEGDVTRLGVIVLTKAGQDLGASSNNIRLGNFTESVNITSAYIGANNKKYSLQEGPTIAKDKFPQLILKIQNKSLEDITLIPSLKVYDLQPSKPVVGENQYDSFVVKAGKTKDLTLDLLTFSKAGVYDGQLYFKDLDGNGRSPIISSRWIVAGDMATISVVNIDRDSFKKGNTAIVNVSYTGSPVNIDTGSSTDVGVGIIKMTLFNEKNEVIAEGQNDVSFNTLGSSTVFKLPVTKDATTVSVKVIAMKDGKELANYSTLLTDITKRKSDGYNTIMNNYILWGVLILLLVAIIIFAFTKRKRIPIALIVLVVLLGVFGHRADIVNARVSWGQPRCSGTTCVGDNNAFYLNTNLEVSNFITGEEMGYTISSRVTALVCANSSSMTTVYYTIYDAAGNQYGNSVSAYNVTGGYASEANLWRDFPSFYPRSATPNSTSVTAPTKPGKYTLMTNTQTTFASAGYGWKTYSGLLNYFSFTVSAPSTDNPPVDPTKTIPTTPTVTPSTAPSSCGINGPVVGDGQTLTTSSSNLCSKVGNISLVDGTFTSTESPWFWTCRENDSVNGIKDSSCKATCNTGLVYCPDKKVCTLPSSCVGNNDLCSDLPGIQTVSDPVYSIAGCKPPTVTPVVTFEKPYADTNSKCYISLKTTASLSGADTTCALDGVATPINSSHLGILVGQHSIVCIAKIVGTDADKTTLSSPPVTKNFKCSRLSTSGEI